MLKKAIFLLMGLSFVFGQGYTNKIKKKTIFNINKGIYKIKYSCKYKGPLIIQYQIDERFVNLKNLTQIPNFYEDDSLPKQCRININDYKNAGYTKYKCANIYKYSLMVPDDEFDYSMHDLKKVYFTSNLSPQTERLYKHIWQKSIDEELKKVYQYGVLKVTILPIYTDKHNFLIKKPLKCYKTIGQWSQNKINQYKKEIQKQKKKKILVPTYFLKKIYNPAYHFQKCYYFKNKSYSYSEILQDNLKKHEINCNIFDIYYKKALSVK